MNDLGYIKEIKTDSVVFIVDVGEVEIEVDVMTKEAIEAIFQEDEEALVPLSADNEKMVLENW